MSRANYKNMLRHKNYYCAPLPHKLTISHLMIDNYTYIVSESQFGGQNVPSHRGRTYMLDSGNKHSYTLQSMTFSVKPVDKSGLQSQHSHFVLQFGPQVN